jgi:hypothetical protein
MNVLWYECDYECMMKDRINKKSGSCHQTFSQIEGAEKRVRHGSIGCGMAQLEGAAWLSWYL